MPPRWCPVGHYFCPQDCPQAAIVVWSKMRTGFRFTSFAELHQNYRVTPKKDRHPWGVYPDGALVGTIFAHKIARKRQSLFGQKCELVFVRERTKAQSDGGVTAKKGRHPMGVCLFLEAPPRFGLGIEVLQTFALPLGHGAIFIQQMNYNTKI